MNIHKSFVFAFHRRVLQVYFRFRAQLFSALFRAIIDSVGASLIIIFVFEQRQGKGSVCCCCNVVNIKLKIRNDNLVLHIINSLLDLITDRDKFDSTRA